MESTPTVTDMMVAYAQDAVDHARSSVGIALDYSPDSIRGVEEILGTLHAALPKGLLGRLFGKGPTAEDVHTMSKMYGGYIGEVFRKAGGGEWGFDTEIVPGAQNICLRKNDQRIWPVAKAYKRITNGTEDSISAYSQVVLADWK